MSRVKFGDVVKDVKINIDRLNNPYEYYVAGDHMDSEDLTIHRKGCFITDDVGPAFIRVFKPGQILYGSRRTYLKKIAVADFEGVCANTTFVFETKDPHAFEQRLLPFIMLSKDFTTWSIAKSKGSTNPYVLFSDLADFEFELPPLEEQKVLADKLWAAYRLKEAYKKLLVATDEMVKSQFIEMFGGLCQDTPWSDVVTITNGKAYPEEYREEGTYPICGSGGIMYYGEKKLCNGNTTILGRKGNINNPIFMESGYWIVDTAFSFDVDKTKLHPRFFHYWCCQYDFTKLNKQGVLSSLTRKDLEKVKMAIPQMKDQIKFVFLAEQADKSKFGDFKSQFIEMFGNCKSQGTLSSLCATFIDGDWIESKDQSDSGIRLIQTGNVGFGFFKGREDKCRYITEETFKKLNCTEVVPGDILISRLPDPIGRACIVPEGIGKAITAVDCTIVRLNATLLPEFLISFSKTALYASQINKIKTGTTRLRVSRGNLGNVIIPIPPIESQHHFAAIAQQADKSKSVIQKALVYLNNIQSDKLGKIA